MSCLNEWVATKAVLFERRHTVVVIATVVFRLSVQPGG